MNNGGSSKFQLLSLSVRHLPASQFVGTPTMGFFQVPAPSLSVNQLPAPKFVGTPTSSSPVCRYANFQLPSLSVRQQWGSFKFKLPSLSVCQLPASHFVVMPTMGFFHVPAPQFVGTPTPYYVGIRHYDLHISLSPRRYAWITNEDIPKKYPCSDKAMSTD